MRQKVLFIITCCIFLNDATSEVNDAGCGNNEYAQTLSNLIRNHPNQQRKKLQCNDKLNEIALIKAGFIIENQNVWHNAGHMAPNQLLRHYGFKLPKTYPLFGNQVEAIAGGEKAAEQVFNDFINSATHKELLLGEDDFFKEQDQLGVAFVEDLATEHEYYWVVIIADEQNKTIKQGYRVHIKPPVSIKSNRSKLREMKERMHRHKVRDRLR